MLFALQKLLKLLFVLTFEFYSVAYYFILNDGIAVGLRQDKRPVVTYRKNLFPNHEDAKTS